MNIKQNQRKTERYVHRNPHYAYPRPLPVILKNQLLMKKSILLILFLVSIKSIGQKSELKITIDERIETLYSVAFLDNYFLIGKHDNLYKQKLVKQLQPLKQHKAVQLFDSLSKNHHFTYYRTVEWALQHSNFPEFQKNQQKFRRQPNLT